MGAGRFDDLRKRLHREVIFDIDIQPRVRPPLKHFGQRGNPFATADPYCIQFSEGMVCYPPGPVSHPVEALVVEDDDDAVACSTYVQLQVPETKVDGRFHSDQGVLTAIA